MHFFPGDDEEDTRCKFIAARSDPKSPTSKAFAKEKHLSRRDPIRANDVSYQMTVAADLLHFVLTAPRDKASKWTAKRIWSRRHALESGRLGRIAANDGSSGAAWRKRRSVVHLGLAWRLLLLWAYKPLKDAPFVFLDPMTFRPTDLVTTPKMFDPGNPETLLNFLAVAEEIRIAGERHYPPTGRNRAGTWRDPTLDPETTYRVPADLKLPKVKVLFPPLTEKVWKNLLEEHKSTRAISQSPG
jgi:hypothetical protein